MPYAAGEFVKIYIYLLKSVSENRSELSISRIADVFNNTEKDVIRALKYWQRKGLLSLTFDEQNALTSLRIMSLTDQRDVTQQPSAQKLTVSVVDAPVPGQPGINEKHARPEQAKVLPVLEEQVSVKSENSLSEVKPTADKTEEPAAAFPEKKEYSAQQILDFSAQEDIQMLFFAIQKYLGRPLTGQDTNTVLYLYDELHFSADLIEYLFEYCVSREKRSIRYIEKTALGWAESGIRSVQAARKVAGIYSDTCYRVMNAFGLGGRKATRSEMEYVMRWTLSYGFDMAMILKACEKTMDQIHQPSFEYTDTILKNWKAAGITTLDEVQKQEEAFALSARKKTAKKVPGEARPAAVNSRFNDFAQRSYDYQMLTRKLRKQS